jgi:hypothetical protein
VGQTLTASAGIWEPTQDSFSYVWKIANTNLLPTATSGWTVITGATTSTYQLKPADADKFIMVEVTGIKAGYTSVKKLVASATVAVARLPFTTTPTPTIIVPVGGVKVGQILTASEGAWSPSQDSYTYQWMSSATADGTYTAIPSSGTTPAAKSTEKTYVLKATDKNRFIKVVVTAKKTGYTDSPQTSAATIAVG